MATRGRRGTPVSAQDAVCGLERGDTRVCRPSCQALPGSVSASATSPLCVADDSLWELSFPQTSGGDQHTAYWSPKHQEMGQHLMDVMCFLGGSEGQESDGNAEDPGSIPALGRSPGGGHGNTLQCSCLGNPMDREAWRATVHGVTKSQTRLSD